MALTHIVSPGFVAVLMIADPPPATTRTTVAMPIVAWEIETDEAANIDPIATALIVTLNGDLVPANEQEGFILVCHQSQTGVVVGGVDDVFEKGGATP